MGIADLAWMLGALRDFLGELMFVTPILAMALRRESLPSADLSDGQEEYGEARSQLAAIVRSSDDAIVGKTLNGVITSWNPGAERLYGYTAKEAVGRPVALLVPPDRPHELPEILTRLTRGESVEHFETVRVRKDGRRIHVSVTISPVRGPGGAIMGASAIARDITERVRAREAQEFLVEAGALLASSLDYETTLASVARLAVPRMSDWCTVDVVGEGGTLQRLAVSHVDPAKAELARELHCHYPQDPNAPYGVPRVLRTGSSELYPEITEAVLASMAEDEEHLEILREVGVESAMVVPLVARGRTLGAIAFVSAESARRFGPMDLRLAEDLARLAALAVDNARLYRDAQAAIRARDEFLSVAAHELRTPMTSLRGFAQLAARQLDGMGTTDPSRIRQSLEMVDLHSKKLSDLVLQLLDVSRVEARRLTLDRRLADLAQLVADVVDEVRAGANDRNLILSIPASAAAFVDPSLIERVISNLVDNAIRYSPESAPIEVQVATPDPGTVVLAVRDHGIGIPPEQKQRIFDCYYQAHAEDHLGGLGLGLYISREIVHLHGGTIEVESPPDGGTRLVVTLPTGFGAEPRPKA